MILSRRSALTLVVAPTPHQYKRTKWPDLRLVHVGMAFNQFLPEPGENTLPMLMQERGYLTGMVGKW